MSETERFREQLICAALTGLIANPNIDDMSWSEVVDNAIKYAAVAIERMGDED